MGGVNSIPAVSQTKSMVQYCAGDTKGARRTQEDFLTGCPGVSQVASVVEYAKGDTDGAVERQKTFLRGLVTLIDGMPVVGHVKGAVHYVTGDSEHGDQCMKTASRTTGVIVGGVGGFLAGGPVGAVAGGVAGGQALDGVTTAVDSAVHKEYRPNGTWYQWDKLVNGQADVGETFDLFVGHTFDGVVGYSSGTSLGPDAQNAVNRLKVRNEINKGGPYAPMRNKYSGAQKVEMNHLPPKSCYKGTQYEALGKSNKAPAVATEYFDHRSAGTTGPGPIGEASRAYITKALKKGDMTGALKKAIDVDYVANKNVMFYKEGLIESIDHCHNNLNVISSSDAGMLKSYVTERATAEVGARIGQGAKCNTQGSALSRKPNQTHEHKE